MIKKSGIYLAVLGFGRRRGPPEPAEDTRPTESTSSTAETLPDRDESPASPDEAAIDEDNTDDSHALPYLDSIASSPARSQADMLGDLADLLSSEGDVSSLMSGVDDGSFPTESLSSEVDTDDPADLFSDIDDHDSKDESEPVNPYAKFKNLFDPIYKDASISLCGAFCAIMEFKRSCRLPFTAIEKLLKLLQLFCPPDNTLPKTLHEIKKFFRAASDRTESRKFCLTCDVELQAKEKYCDAGTCERKEPSTLVVLNTVTSIKRVLTSKLLV